MTRTSFEDRQGPFRKGQPKDGNNPVLVLLKPLQVSARDFDRGSGPNGLMSIILEPLVLSRVLHHTFFDDKERSYDATECCRPCEPRLSCSGFCSPCQCSSTLVEYVPPKNPAHQTIYDEIKQAQALERIQELLSPLRLPRLPLVKVTGCDGESNAWYDEDTITVCYEFWPIF
jgi:hypothetical protein